MINTMRKFKYSIINIRVGKNRGVKMPDDEFEEDIDDLNLDEDEE